MEREAIIKALHSDPTLVVEYMGQLIGRMHDLLEQQPKKQPVERRYQLQAQEPKLVGGMWISYIDAATVTGRPINTMRQWIHRGSVAGGEGFMDVDSLLDHLRRNTAADRCQVEYERLVNWLGKVKSEEPGPLVPGA